MMRSSSTSGFVVLFTSRLMRLPVFASASHRSMKTSPRRKLPLDRKAMCSPSSEMAGARKIAPPLRRSVRSGAEKVRARCSVAICGRCFTCIASFHSSPRSSSDLPVSRRNARSTPTLGVACMIAPIVSSPHRWPMYDQSACPTSYGLNRSGRTVNCSMFGMRPLSAASRMTVAACGSTGPIDRYSAIPSANQSGGFTWASVCSPAPALPRAKMSYWNSCTISCVRICSKLP